MAQRRPVAAGSIALALLLAAAAVGTLFVPAAAARADGRLLRGEKWQRFRLDGNRADFYVAPDGNDAWSGTAAAANADKSDGPFATIQRAQRAVRQRKQAVYKKKESPIEKRWIGSPHKFGRGRDILVLVRGGYYCLPEPIVFAPADGGERCETNLPSGAFEYHKLKDYFVTYAAYPDETPILSGGVQLGPWHNENGLWVTTTGGIEVRKLLADGAMQLLARTPNQGYYAPAEMPLSDRVFRFRPGELQNWPQLQDNRIVMLLRWHTGINTIARIDPQQRTVELRKPQQGLRVVPPRYYVENVKALLDAPGEWFFDRAGSQLSYLPAEGSPDPAAASIVAPVLQRLVSVEGTPARPVRNLRFYGLTLEAANVGGSAIALQYAHNCELVDSTVRGVAGTAVRVEKGCYHNRILHNRVEQAEQGGIAVAGAARPERWQDIIRDTVIAGNMVSQCGGRSIAASNCLNTVISRNEVTRNRGRTGIHVGGWANLEEAIDGGYRVEYNHVHHVQQQADDSGAITTAGLTHDSLLRGNLIHDVQAGYFNDNVAIWFDNMSSGWRAEANIFYNLGQGEMKLCASNLVDNVYRDNYLVECPENPPEQIITGLPDVTFAAVQTGAARQHAQTPFATGQPVTVRTVVRNTGSTGVVAVDLYVDGRVAQARKFPVIHNNQSEIQFQVQFARPGQHTIAIGTAPYTTVAVEGEKLPVLYDALTLSDTTVPVGAGIRVSTRVASVEDHELKLEVPLRVDGTVAATQTVKLAAKQSRTVHFDYQPQQGRHQIGVGSTPPAALVAYPHHPAPIVLADLRQYSSGTAGPCRYEVDAERNRLRLQVAGTDFCHGEDSYGVVFLPSVQGNFVATAKISRFGPKTHEWFRAGLFARNDLTASFTAGAGSRGSALLFATPGRVGMNWDEYGDGCMHRTHSRNRQDNARDPVWLKLVRHGDSFTGYVSQDGQNWTIAGRTGALPGLAPAVDIGLAAGGPDQRVYEVEFEDFRLAVEDAQWR